MITRRYWVRQVSAAAAAVGLPSNSLRTAQFFQATGDKRAHLKLALQAAKWIAAQRQAGHRGDRYPADPLHPDSVGIDFYNGMPGIVVFFAGLFHATQNVEWLRLAKTVDVY